MRYTQCTSKITGIECIGWGGHAGFEYAYANGSFDNGVEVKKIHFEQNGMKCWSFEVQPEIILCP